jgi:hypothetical protein
MIDYQRQLNLVVEKILWIMMRTKNYNFSGKKKKTIS